jgi:hypothetical protein
MSLHGLWHLETSLHRLQQSRFLRRSEGRLWVLSSIRIFKTSLKRLRPSRFSMPWMQKMSSHGFRHLETTHDGIQYLFFKTFREQIMTSHGHSPTENFTYGASFKSHFTMRRMQKMSTHGFCHLKHHFVVCTKVYLRRSEGRLWILWAIDRHKNHLSDFVQAAFFDALYSEYESSLPFVTMKHPFIDITKVVFKTSRKRIMCS